MPDTASRLANSRLAKRYRRLLVWYPREYRRQRGREIVDTLLDLAPPSRSRPTVRHAANLARHGLRCRLGRPASRSVVVWAVLTALVWGLFVAAFAVRAAWQTARPLPDGPTATRTFASLFPGEDFGGAVQPGPAMFVVYGSPLGPEHLEELLFGDGGEYQLGETSAGFFGPANDGRSPGVIVERLRAGGWAVGEPRVSNAMECTSTPPCDPSTLPTQTLLTARRGADLIEITVYPSAGSDETNVHLSLQRATPWLAYPAGIAGGVLGTAVGWLVFGWASRRIEHRHPALRGITNGVYGVAMVLWGLPILLVLPVTLIYHLVTPQLRWPPLWEWLGQPTASLLFLAGTGAALLTLAVAALPHRGSDPAMDATTR